MGFWGTFIVARCDHELMDLDPLKASAAAFSGSRSKTALVVYTDGHPADLLRQTPEPDRDAASAHALVDGATFAERGAAHGAPW